MKTVDLPYFGTVSLNQDSNEEDYTAFMRYNDSLIQLDLNYEPQETHESDFILVRDFFECFEIKVDEAIQSIFQDYKNDGIAKGFIQTHLDALMPLGKELLKETLAKGQELDQYFLNELELNRIFIFPDSPDEFISLNFQISSDFTDEILVVLFGKDLKFQELHIEYE